MEFGYFTLSDNHYENNPRNANQFVTDITNEAIYADQLGMHSAWIGEHHFNSLGVLSSPELVLSYVAARTKHIRLAPAVNVTPLHHPIRVAEQWATLDLLSNGRVDFASGRGYDAREYAPFKVAGNAGVECPGAVGHDVHVIEMGVEMHRSFACRRLLCKRPAALRMTGFSEGVCDG